MKTFTASQELINLLLKNGFVEITEKIYPEHFKAHFNEWRKNGYNPHSKRAFSLNNSITNYIYFDYGVLYLVHRTLMHKTNLPLTEDQLKSIIVFYKLPQKFKSICDGIVNLYTQQDKHGKTKKEIAFYKELKQLFEKVIL